MYWKGIDRKEGRQLLKNWKRIEPNMRMQEVRTQANLTRQPILIDDKTALTISLHWSQLLLGIYRISVMFFHQNNRKYLRVVILNAWHGRKMNDFESICVVTRIYFLDIFSIIVTSFLEFVWLNGWIKGFTFWLPKSKAYDVKSSRRMNWNDLVLLHFKFWV